MVRESTVLVSTKLYSRCRAVNNNHSLDKKNQVKFNAQAQPIAYRRATQAKSSTKAGLVKFDHYDH